MKSYTKVYYTFFDLDLCDFVACELCGSEAVDISHIEAKGRRPDLKDDIRNIMAMCRFCHESTGDKKDYKEVIQKIHVTKMINHLSNKYGL